MPPCEKHSHSPEDAYDPSPEYIRERTFLVPMVKVTGPESHIEVGKAFKIRNNCRATTVTISGMHNLKGRAPLPLLSFKGFTATPTSTWLWPWNKGIVGSTFSTLVRAVTILK